MKIKSNIKEYVKIFFIAFFFQILNALDLKYIGIIFLNLISCWFIIKAIGPSYLISLIKNIYMFKQELIDNYINFLDFVLTNEDVPPIFYKINYPLGLILSRQFISFFNITFSGYCLFIMLLGPFVWCLITFIILYGYYCLCISYLFFGKPFLRFVKANASEEVLKKLKLKR